MDGERHTSRTPREADSAFLLNAPEFIGRGNEINQAHLALAMRVTLPVQTINRCIRPDNRI